MTLNTSPSSERVHIAFFGLRNAGKSSLVNAVTNQKLSLVSDTPGTTTDPVKKSMELLPLGPVVIIDTPGIDDEGRLGMMRVKRAFDMLDSADIAVLVVDAVRGMTETDFELVNRFTTKKIPYVIARNKADLLKVRENLRENEIYVSSISGEGVVNLREAIGRLGNAAVHELKLVPDLIKAG